MYIAVASPSVSGLVAMMTSVIPLCHDADRTLVALWGRTDAARLLIREVLTDGAAVYILFRIHNGVCKLQRLLLREGQNMKCQPLRAFAPDPGQTCQSIHGLRHLAVEPFAQCVRKSDDVLCLRMMKSDGMNDAFHVFGIGARKCGRSWIFAE